MGITMTMQGCLSALRPLVNVPLDVASWSLAVMVERSFVTALNDASAKQFASSTNTSVGM
jgi:hypothetical protein